MQLTVSGTNTLFTLTKQKSRLYCTGTTGTGYRSKSFEENFTEDHVAFAFLASQCGVWLLWNALCITLSTRGKNTEM